MGKRKKKRNENWDGEGVKFIGKKIKGIVEKGERKWKTGRAKGRGEKEMENG